MIEVATEDFLESHRYSDKQPQHSIFVSLIPKTQEPRSMPLEKPEIAVRLQQRGKRTSLKLSEKRIQRKLEELCELQTVPKINKNSRKIAELTIFNKKQAKRLAKPKSDSDSDDNSFYKCLEQYSANLSNINKSKPSDSTDLINYNNSELEAAIKLRENIEQSPKKPIKINLSLLERGEQMKKNKLDRIKQAESEKQLNELKECTFKPDLSMKAYKKGASLNITGNKSMGLNTSTPKSIKILQSKIDPKGNLQKHIFEEIFELSPVKPCDCEYSQVSPADVKLSYKTGHNRRALKLKSSPSIDYLNQASLLE